MAEILREMNAKLKRILPVGVFCCATMLNLSFQRRVVEVWNGGLPDGHLLRVGSGERVPLVSRHLPLGVLDPSSFNEAYEVHPLQPGDRIFLLSDGVLETRDASEQLFGEERLLQVFDSGHAPERLFDEIQRALAAFRGEAQDDVSMIELSMVDDSDLSRPPLAFSDSGQSSPLDWSASFEFRAEALKRFNPLPFLLQLLMEVRGLRAQGGALYTVMAELYSNALEHGVLGLDSKLKSDAQGFAQYYRERSQRLLSLQEGFVRFDLELLPEAGGGCLRIHVQDSGAGFDVSRALDRQRDCGSLSGRGLRLICELADQCRWSSDGRGAIVEFRWAAQA
jgi:hypothetical protein